MPFLLNRRTMLATGSAAALGLPLPARAQPGTLRIAMTTADIPTIGGIPNNGAEGYRFAGYTMYEGLTNWDLTATDHIAGIVPGLATAWQIDKSNTKRWIFILRQGVKFHDGTAFDADAVVWNLQRSYDQKAPHYDGAAAPIVAGYVSMVERWEKVSDDTVAIYTKFPFSAFPYLATRILMVSPSQYREDRPKLGGIRQGARRYRSVQFLPGRAARTHRAHSERRLLGQGEGAEDRDPGAVADARPCHPGGGAPVRAG